MLTTTIECETPEARQEAAPIFWLLSVNTERSDDHAVFATREEAVAALLEMIREEYLAEGVTPPVDEVDADERFYCSDLTTVSVAFHIFKAPLGSWAESL
jgi:hypothetical protein